MNRTLPKTKGNEEKKKKKKIKTNKLLKKCFIWFRLFSFSL